MVIEQSDRLTRFKTSSFVEEISSNNDKRVLPKAIEYYGKRTNVQIVKDHISQYMNHFDSMNHFDIKVVTKQSWLFIRACI